MEPALTLQSLPGQPHVHLEYEVQLEKEHLTMLLLEAVITQVGLCHCLWMVAIKQAVH